MINRFFLCVLMAIPSWVSGQQFFLGAKGGVEAFTSRYQNPEIRYNIKNGIRGGMKGGGILIFPLPDEVSFVVELEYSIMGRRTKYFDCSLINKSTYNFIEFPLLLRKTFNLNINNFASGVYVNIGPNIKYWMGGTSKIMEISAFGGDSKYSIQFSDTLAGNNLADIDPKTKDPIFYMTMVNPNRFIYGLDFGIGYVAHVLGNQRFYAEARFTYVHTYLGKHNSEIQMQSQVFTNYILQNDLRSAFRVVNLSFGWARHFDFRKLKKGQSTIDRKKRIRK